MVTKYRVNMTEKMLKFVKIGQQTPPKRELVQEKKILMKFIKNLSMVRLVNNLVDALNAVFLFARYTVH